MDNLGFFDIEYEKEWENMPEFNQKDKTPYRTLYIHFQNEEAIKEFSNLIK